VPQVPFLHLAGNTPIAVAKIWGRGTRVRAVSERVCGQQVGFATARMRRRNSAVLSLACLPEWKISCVQGRRSVLCARQRSRSEIPGWLPNLRSFSATFSSQTMEEKICFTYSGILLLD
jgi:hypothetical protein